MSKERVRMLARRGFEAYNGQGPNPGFAHDGRPVPVWDEISEEKREQIHGKWSAAAESIAAAVIDELDKLLRAGLLRNELVDCLREDFSSSEAPAITYSGDSA